MRSSLNIKGSNMLSYKHTLRIQCESYMTLSLSLLAFYLAQMGTHNINTEEKKKEGRGSEEGAEIVERFRASKVVGGAKGTGLLMMHCPHPSKTPPIFLFQCCVSPLFESFLSAPLPSRLSACARSWSLRSAGKIISLRISSGDFLVFFHRNLFWPGAWIQNSVPKPQKIGICTNPTYSFHRVALQSEVRDCSYQHHSHYLRPCS